MHNYFLTAALNVYVFVIFEDYNTRLTQIYDWL